MIVIAHPDIYKTIVNPTGFQNTVIAKNVLFNEHSLQMMSKDYLELLEQNIIDVESFQSLITELSDLNQIFSVNSNGKSTSLNEEFIRLCNITYTETKQPVIIPVAIDIDNNLQKEAPNVCFTSLAVKPNINWVKKELVTKSSCNVSYVDFASNNQVQSFFDSLFLIPNVIRKAYIFDRSLCGRLKNKLKGKNINYYTLLTCPLHELKRSKKDLEKSLGGKVKLFYTNNKRLIHERKIIAENITITCDNSFENIVVEEPTWHINIQYSPNEIFQWKSDSLDKFKECI